MPIDAGLTPPPPPDVISQMQGGAAPAAPLPDLGALLAKLSAAPVVDLAPEVMELDPVMQDLARQVPALAPDVKGLMDKMRTKVAPTPLMGMPGVTPGAPMGANMQAPMPQPGPMGPQPGMGSPAPMMGPGSGMPPPAPLSETPRGAMGLALQVEMLLPKVSAKDPSMSSDVQYFIARMREEVPRQLEGTVLRGTPAPNDTMLSNIPVPA